MLTWDAVEGAMSYDVRYSARNYAFNDPNKWDPWVAVRGDSGHHPPAASDGPSGAAVRRSCAQLQGPGAWCEAVVHPAPPR